MSIKQRRVETGVVEFIKSQNVKKYELTMHNQYVLSPLFFYKFSRCCNEIISKNLKIISVCRRHGMVAETEEKLQRNLEEYIKKK